MLKQAVIDLAATGTAIVFSSHQMDHVEQLCENICILREGKTVVQGNLTNIKQSYGKKNLRIYADESLQFLENFDGVVNYESLIGGCLLQIENETVSQDIFNALQGKGFIRR